MARANAKNEVVDAVKMTDAIKIPEEKTAFRYSIPMADDDGSVPQFVNITGKIQLVTVPYENTKTIRVEPWGILEGAQWRSPYASPNKSRKFPPFCERVKTDGEYDQKYILTEEQALSEMKRLWTNDPDETERVKKRIQALVDNMVIGKNGMRHMDDRVAVLTLMSDKIRKLEIKRQKVLNG